MQKTINYLKETLKKKARLDICNTTGKTIIPMYQALKRSNCLSLYNVIERNLSVEDFLYKSGLILEERSIYLENLLKVGMTKNDIYKLENRMFDLLKITLKDKKWDCISEYRLLILFYQITKEISDITIFEIEDCYQEFLSELFIYDRSNGFSRSVIMAITRKLKQQYSSVEMSNFESLNKYLDNNDFIDLDFERMLIRKENKDAVEDVIKTINHERTEKIIKMFMERDCNRRFYSKIGHEFDISRERARQIIWKQFQDPIFQRRLLRALSLKAEYYDDYNCRLVKI